MIITPEEMLAEAVRLHAEVVGLLNRIADAEGTQPVALFVGAMNSVELILENLVQAGPPLTDDELTAMARRQIRSVLG
jgi:hypothetical protein